MSIQWGAWEYSGGNGMRVGIEVTRTSVSHSSTSCTVTFKVYTQNQYSYSDSQSLNITGTTDWPNVSFTNDDGTGAVRRSTKTYTYNFTSSDYGSGTAKTVTLNATLSGAYNGVTPSKSASINIPKRPYDRPAPASGQNADRINDGQINVLWAISSTAGEPITATYVDRWDNVSNAYTRVANLGAVTSYANTGLSGNRRYRYRVLTGGPGGNATAWAYTEFVQTTPAAPTGCSVSKSAVDAILVSWNNAATTTNGYAYDTLLEEQVDGGAWTQIATIAAGTASYSRTGRSPGSVYAYRVRARSSVDETTYSGYSTSGTIQLIAPPAAPTGFGVVRNSDTSHTLSWTDNPTADAPYESITVQRWSEASGAWVTVGTLADTATNLTDTDTVADNAYKWRVRANNQAGSSDWATSGTFQTTPDAPSSLKAKAGADSTMIFTWANNVGYSDYSIILRYYKDDVLVTDTVSLTSGTTSYTISNVTLTSSYRFGVKAKSNIGSQAESAWVDTANVPASTVPNAPANLAPTGKVIDLNLDQVFTWTHTPSLDESDQTAFEVQYSTDGGSAWTTTGKVVSTASSWTMPASTLANGPDVTWQVRTWGVHATASPWSASAVFQTSTTPTTTINSPSSGVLTTSVLDVVWAYNDAEASPQAHWDVELRTDAGALIEAKSGDDASTSTTLATVVTDGSSYVLRVQVRDGDGLTSAWAEKALVADFTPPAMPTLAADYSQEAGVVVLTLTPTEDTPPGTLVATNLYANPSFETNTTTWGGVAGRTTITRASGAGIIGVEGEYVGLVDVTDNSITIAGQTIVAGPLLPATPGLAYSALARISRTNGTAPTTARLVIQFLDAANANLGTFHTVVDTVSGSPSTIHEYKVEGAVAPANTTQVRVQWQSNGAIPSGSQYRIDAHSLVEGDVHPGYFDGDTPRDDTYYYEWTGTPHASTSVKKLIGTLPTSGVDIQRRIYQSATETWGDWVTLAEGVAPDATLIDTTSPIANDGEYRITAHSSAPSAATSESQPPTGFDDRWVYVSGGPNFQQSCRLMGNISLRTTTSRDRSIYKFAGRKKPVMFAGENTETVVDVAGLLDGESSSPSEWEHLIETCDVLLFRDPMGHRIYGSIPQVAIDYLGNEMYAISFTVTEVSYP